MAIERFKAKLPDGFDSRIHTEKLKATVAKAKGPGWQLDSISAKDGVAWFKRQSDVMEVERVKDALVYDLPYGTKASDGDRVAAQQADAHPGYYLVKFEPHIGRAVLAKMSEPELRCRAAVANALGVKPWDVTVRARSEGGFNLALPNSYSPSKHDAKLQEVAEAVVGRFGWVFEADAQKLTARILPSDPPTFPDKVPFPFDAIKPVDRWDAVGDAERFTFKLAEGLGAPGKPNVSIEMSLDDANSLLIVGLPGSGKALEDSTMLPVPVSDRFPDGWARNDELVEGDQLYAPDSTLTTIIGFSDWRTEDRYVVRFSDGQRIATGAGHLWKVRSNDAPRPTGTPQNQAEADRLRAKAARYVGTGAVAALADIAALAGYDETDLDHLRDSLTHLATKAYPVGLDTAGRELALYPVDETLVMLAESVEAPDRQPSQRIVTTAEMMEGRAKWAVRVPAPIGGEPVQQPVDPWLLGAWLAGGLPGAKRIPALYRRASFEQRLAVLQGLMDTGGHVDPAGGCELILPTHDVANDIVELIRSLGIKASAKDRRIRFTTDLAVFRTPHKAERLPKTVPETERWNDVEDIAVSGQARTRCIKVDHPEHLFLVEGFVPTHNSIAVRGLVYQALIKGFRVAVVDTPAKRSDYGWLKPYVEDHWWGCEDSGNSVAEALTVVSLLDEEGKRLGALCEEHGVSKWQDLPPAIKKANPPILVVADELANLLSKPNVPTGLTKEAKALPMFVEMAQNYMESKLLTAKLNALVAVHRAVGMREAYLSQRPSKTEGFPPELKSLIPHRIQLGPNPSDADLAMAFRDPKRVPRVPGNIASDEDAARGCGIAHLDGANPIVIKGFWAPDADYETLLRKHLGPGDPSDARVRPTAKQIDRHVPRINEEGDDEAPQETSFAFGQERLPSGKPVSSLDPKFGPAPAQFDENGKRLRGAAAAAKASKRISDTAPTLCPTCGEPIDPKTDTCGCL